jgi:hypothetical protein
MLASADLGQLAEAVRLQLSLAVLGKLVAAVLKQLEKTD